MFEAYEDLQHCILQQGQCTDKTVVLKGTLGSNLAKHFPEIYQVWSDEIIPSAHKILNRKGATEEELVITNIPRGKKHQIVLKKGMSLSACKAEFAKQCMFEKYDDSRVFVVEESKSSKDSVAIRGLAGSWTKDIIPEVHKVLNRKDASEKEVILLDILDKYDLPIKKGMSLEECVEECDDIVDARNYEPCNDEDGKYYTCFQEALDDLKDIKPVDLTSGKISTTQAVRFCEKVMKVFEKAQKLPMSNKRCRQLMKSLDNLGCVGPNEAWEGYIKNASDSAEINAQLKNDISFPLAVFGQFRHSVDNARFAMSLMGGRVKPETWLEAQKDENVEVNE